MLPIVEGSCRDDRIRCYIKAPEVGAARRKAVDVRDLLARRYPSLDTCLLVLQKRRSTSRTRFGGGASRGDSRGRPFDQPEGGNAADDISGDGLTPSRPTHTESVIEMKTKIKIHLPSSAPDQAVVRLVLGRLLRLVT